MKIKMLKHVIPFLLCFALITSLTAGSFFVSARYGDDFNGSYEDLHCKEDDCDCLEPDNNRFRVVSPSSAVNTHDTIVFTGAYHEVLNYYTDLGQTDGLPIIPPTFVKVEKFMRYTAYDDNDVIATLNGRDVTAYQVAVNAVMSGCFAEFMPVCIAIVKAMGSGDYLDSVADGSLIPMAFINGPIGRQIGIDNTQGMTTEEVNIELARFIEFALINLAGTAPDRSSSFGSVQPLVFSENDQACLNIGWEPYHVSQGFDLNDSTVTLTSFSMWGNNVTPATDLPKEVMKIIAWDITEKNLGGLGSADSETYAETKRTILITPPVASVLSSLYKSKEALEGDLVETARRPLWMRTFAYYYANTAGVLTGRKTFVEVYNELKATESEDVKLTASPAWMSGITNPQIETTATMKAGNTRFIVTGDDSRNKTQVMPGGEGVTVKVEFPDEWDALMTSMSYKALDDYNLTGAQSVTVEPATVPDVLTDGVYRILDPATGSTYLTAAGRLYFDAASNTLYYYAYGSSAKSQVTLNAEEDAGFIAYIGGLGYNSSFTVSDHKITNVVIRFPSNAKKPSINTADLTAASFEGIGLTLHANNAQSASAGGIAQNGATVTMSSSVTSFNVDLGGTVVMGDSSADGFLILNGSSVTLDPYAGTGATAIIGVKNSDNTYRTLTFVLYANGTYVVTYNTAGTLSLDLAAVYLNMLSPDESIEFNKTEAQGVYVLTKHLAVGEYSFNVAIGSTTYGNSTGFTNSCDRLLLSDTEGSCTMVVTAENDYVFKFDSNSNKLTVVKDITGTVPSPESFDVHDVSDDVNIAPLGTIIVDSVSTEYSEHIAAHANDGDKTTRWQSDHKGNDGDDAWIGIDLGEARKLAKLVVEWETAHPTKDGFKVQISSDGETWVDTPFAFKRTGEDADDHQTDTIILTDTPNTRFIRVYCYRAYSNSLGVKESPSAWEFEVYAAVKQSNSPISPAVAQLSADGKSIRFIAAIESLDFAEVGFTVSITNSEGRIETVTVSDNKVYKSLTYNGTTLTSEDFGIEDGYLFVLVIKNIPSDFSVSVIPFATETVANGGARVAAQVRDFAIVDRKASLIAA